MVEKVEKNKENEALKKVEDAAKGLSSKEKEKTGEIIDIDAEIEEINNMINSLVTSIDLSLIDPTEWQSGQWWGKMEMSGLNKKENNKKEEWTKEGAQEKEKEKTDIISQQEMTIKEIIRRIKAVIAQSPENTDILESIKTLQEKIGLIMDRQVIPPDNIIANKNARKNIQRFKMLHFDIMGIKIIDETTRNTLTETWEKIMQKENEIKNNISVIQSVLIQKIQNKIDEGAPIAQEEPITEENSREPRRYNEMSKNPEWPEFVSNINIIVDIMTYNQEIIKTMKQNNITSMTDPFYQNEEDRENIIRLDDFVNILQEYYDNERYDVVSIYIDQLAWISQDIEITPSTSAKIQNIDEHYKKTKIGVTPWGWAITVEVEDNDENFKKPIEIGPNPINKTGTLTLRLWSMKYDSMQIIDMQGKIVKEINKEKLTPYQDAQGKYVTYKMDDEWELAWGMYICRIYEEANTENFTTNKLIVE